MIQIFMRKCFETKLMIINFLYRSSDRTGDGSVVNPDMRTSIPVSSTGKAERILRAPG